VTRLRHLRRQARLAWHVFRGRPLAYRVRVEGRLVITGADTRVVDCGLAGLPDAPRARPWRRLVTWFRKLGDRQFREDMYGIRVRSREALRRYDAEHGTSLAKLAADPEVWRR
jgi:hypothetical protein